MRIYDVSCNAYSNKRNNPTFGFWQPQMSSLYEVSGSVKQLVKKTPNIRGNIISTKIPNGGWLDNFKIRHVNIKGTREKIERTTFNHYDYDGITHKYQQDLYPNGDLITTIKSICNKGAHKIEEFIENIR